MRYCVLGSICVVILTLFATGQTGSQRIEIVRKGKYFSFPIIKSPSGSAATTKINRFLQLSELYVLAKRADRSMFRRVEVDDGSIYGGKVSMNASIFTNSRSILSIGFDESSCGMTCTYWHKYYNFNPANGYRIDLADLFTSLGFEAFKKRIVRARSAKYRREVRKKVAPEYQEGYLDTIGCFENDDLSDFYIHNRTVVIDGENCLIKGQKFDGLDMVVRFRLAEFRKHLNAYGRLVFQIGRGSIVGVTSERLPQLFQGSVDGKYPIVMVLNRKLGNGFDGMYAYIRHGEGIGLRGNETASGVNLTEYVLSPTVEMKVYGPVQKSWENGYISGVLKDGRLEATWSSVDGSRKLPLSVSLR